MDLRSGRGEHSGLILGSKCFGGWTELYVFVNFMPEVMCLRTGEKCLPINMNMQPLFYPLPPPTQPVSAQWPVWSRVRRSKGREEGCPICLSNMKARKINRRWCFQMGGTSASVNEESETRLRMHRQTVFYRPVSLSFTTTLGSFA